MKPIKDLVPEFFLTDLCKTTAYKEIQQSLFDKYGSNIEHDEELPYEYYEELTAKLTELLTQTIIYANTRSSKN